MNSIKSLKNIFSKLTLEEKNVLLKNLNNKNETKTIKLINLLISEIKYSTAELQNIIHGKINYYAFNKLLNRVKQKIYETIIFESSISSNEFSRRNEINIDLRKKLLQADILQLKGLRNEVLTIYNYIINKSKKYELYDIKVQALNSKQRLQFSSKIKSFNKINDEIIFTENCLLALKESNNIYKEIINKINNSSNNLSYIDDLKIYIHRLENYYQTYKSPTIGFYFYTLRAEMYENEFKFNDAKKDLENVKSILLRNQSAYTNNRYGAVLLNLSNNNIFLLNFDLSIKLAIESKNYFKNLPLTLKIVDEILFYSYFYKFNFIECKNILLDNENNRDVLIKNKFNYFNACLLFITGNFLDSLELLLNLNEIEKDMEGWNINRRILLILCRIELRDYDSVDLDLQNLNQFIKRVSKKKVILTRYIFILKILTKLIQENFNFEFVYEKRIKYFKLLDSKNQLYEWKLKSPELIIFQNWYMFKMHKSKMNNYLRLKSAQLLY